MNRLVAMSFVVLLATTGAVAESGERANPEPVAQCFDIRGWMSLYNGTPSVRIWIVGTQRLLGVYEVNSPDRSEDPLMPPEVKALLTDFQTQIIGDYTVCPLTQYMPGEMQIVFVKEARNLVSRVRQ
jgi:hypothetical protein